MAPMPSEVCSLHQKPNGQLRQSSAQCLSPESKYPTFECSRMCGKLSVEIVSFSLWMCGLAFSIPSSHTYAAGNPAAVADALFTVSPHSHRCPLHSAHWSLQPAYPHASWSTGSDEYAGTILVMYAVSSGLTSSVNTAITLLGEKPPGVSASARLSRMMDYRSYLGSLPPERLLSSFGMIA